MLETMTGNTIKDLGLTGLGGRFRRNLHKSQGVRMCMMEVMWQVGVLRM